MSTCLCGRTWVRPVHEAGGALVGCSSSGEVRRRRWQPWGDGAAARVSWNTGSSAPSPTEETPFEAGIRVQIHTQEEPPIIDQLGFGAAPGYQVFVSCQQQQVSSPEPPSPSPAKAPHLSPHPATLWAGLGGLHPSPSQCASSSPWVPTSPQTLLNQCLCS